MKLIFLKKHLYEKVLQEPHFLTGFFRVKKELIKSSFFASMASLKINYWY